MNAKKVSKVVVLGVCAIGSVVTVISNKKENNTLEYPLMYSTNAMEHLTGKWEGCRTRAYKDTGGLWTQGVGHLCGKYKPTDVLTIEQVADLLNKDLYHAEQCVLDNFNGHNLTQGQREALTDFVFNVGCKKATVNSSGNSTRIKRYALMRSSLLCDEFLKWSMGRNEKGQLVQLKGLYNRRLDERNWCLK